MPTRPSLTDYCSTRSSRVMRRLNALSLSVCVCECRQLHFTYESTEIPSTPDVCVLLVSSNWLPACHTDSFIGGTTDWHALLSNDSLPTDQASDMSAVLSTRSSGKLSASCPRRPCHFSNGESRLGINCSGNTAS